MNWQTGTETNTLHFTTGRSTHGKDFTGIGTVAALGNSVAHKNYLYTNENAFAAKQNINAGYAKTFDASVFAKGMYIITLQSASTRQQLKIIK